MHELKDKVLFKPTKGSVKGVLEATVIGITPMGKDTILELQPADKTYMSGQSVLRKDSEVKTPVPQPTV